MYLLSLFRTLILINIKSIGNKSVEDLSFEDEEINTSLKMTRAFFALKKDKY